MKLCCDVGNDMFFFSFFFLFPPLAVCVLDLGRGLFPVISRSWFRQGRYSSSIGMDGTCTVQWRGGVTGMFGVWALEHVWMGSKKAMFGSIDDLFIHLFSTLKFHYHDYRDTDGWNAC